MTRIIGIFIAFIRVFTGINTAQAKVIIQDTFVDETLKDYAGKELPAANPLCNFESTARVAIVMRPMQTIRSKNGINGTTVSLRVKEDVFYKNKLLVPRGTEAIARVETVATQGMNGIPAMIVLDRFEIPGLDSAKMKSSYIKKGLNLTYIVLPVKWALTILPPTGSLTNFIVGGPAKISPKNDVTIYYYPEWECVDTDFPM